VKSKILTMQRGEITEHFIYQELAKSMKDPSLLLLLVSRMIFQAQNTITLTKNQEQCKIRGVLLCSCQLTKTLYSLSTKKVR
jgi:hypothetical protein